MDNEGFDSRLKKLTAQQAKYISNDTEVIVAEYKKKLKDLGDFLWNREADKVRQLKLEHEQKQKDTQQRLASLLSQIEQDIEKWHNLVCALMELLGREYWGSGYSLAPSDKPNSEDIFKMATTAIEDGAVCHTWVVQKGLLGFLKNTINKFEVTLFFVKDTEATEHLKSYLFIGACNMGEHEVTTYEELVALLLQAFANGPLVEYSYSF